MTAAREIAIGDWFVRPGKFDPRRSTMHCVRKVTDVTVHYTTDGCHSAVIDKASILFFGSENICRHLLAELERFERTREQEERHTRNAYASCREAAIGNANRMMMLDTMSAAA